MSAELLKRRILVVDDDRDQLNLAVMLLKDGGSEAGDGMPKIS